MIELKGKVIFIFVLVVFSFFNNIVLTFDKLKELTKNQEIEVFFQRIDDTVEVENAPTSYVKMIGKYILYFVFFYNIDDITSTLEVSNAG